MKTKGYKKARFAIRNTAICALACAFISVSAMISIPFAVPISMQSFALYFCLFYLGGKKTSLSVLLYIGIGALGAPVFAGFSGGFSRLLDASGGFIFGLLLAALVYLLLSVVLPRCCGFKVLCAIISHLVLYLCGTLWYALVYLGGGEGAIFAAFAGCVLPFVIPDAAKLLLAFILAKRLPRLK